MKRIAVVILASCASGLSYEEKPYQRPQPQEPTEKERAQSDLRSALLANATGALAEMGLSRKQVGDIAKNLMTGCSQTGGCGDWVIAPVAERQRTDEEIAHDMIAERKRPVPEPEPQAPGPAPAPEPPTFWCFSTADGFGACFADESSCDDLRNRVTHETGHTLHVELCARQDVAACFDEKSKLTGAKGSLCAPSLSTCGKLRKLQNPEDFQVLTDCKSTKAGR